MDDSGAEVGREPESSLAPPPKPPPPPETAAGVPPPPAQPIGAPHPPHAVEPPKPVRELGVAAQVAVGLTSLAMLVGGYVRFDRRGTLVDFRDGNGTVSDILSADDRVAATSLISLLGLLVAGIVFIVWFHRAYKNLSLRGATKHGTGWAIGAWFVPFLNFWRPGKMAQELIDDGNGEGTAPAGLLWTWWWLFVVASIVDRGFRQNDTIDQAITNDTIGGIGGMLMGVAGVALVLLIGRITATQGEGTAVAAA